MTSGTESPQRHVRALLRTVLLKPVHLVSLSAADLDLVICVARRERLLGALALRLQANGKFDSLPTNAKDQLRSGLVLAESRAALALWELNRIALALTETETRCVVMKGCAYLLLERPFAKGRIFADVDLMLPESDLQAVEAVLNRHGWRSQELTAYDQNYYRKWTHELPPLLHIEREVEIDLHHNILPRTARSTPDARKLMERAIPQAGTGYWILADEDLVLHAITHLMFNDDLADKLRELVDIDELLRHFSKDDDDFWRRLVERADELDLRRATYYGCRYASRILGTPIPDRTIDATRPWGPPVPVRWIMDRLVPEALYAPHPDHRSRLSEFSRLLLYMRSHWIRMPPWLLVYHLASKFWMKHFSWRLRRGAD